MKGSQRPADQNTHYKWKISESVFQAGRKGTFDDIAVKDPSIVYHNGMQHLFYTAKGETTTSGYPSTSTSIGYVAASEFSKLNQAPRKDLNAGGRLCPKPLCAPQVFYFSPHKIWYMIAQVPIDGRLGVLPVFMTNPDLSDPAGWSRPEIFSFQRRLETFWIDFWVIADDEGSVHLFYTDHDGRMFRQETRVEDFPYGFGTEQEAVFVRGTDARGPWRLHEASHLYRLAGDGGYVALLEAVRPHPLNPAYWDSRSRFMFAMYSPSLRGPWKRVEGQEDVFWGDPDNLLDQHGDPTPYGQISHPEAIRTRADEKPEVESITPKVLIQTFDATAIDEHFRYDFLPWKLFLVSHHQ